MKQELPFSIKITSFARPLRVDVDELMQFIWL